MAMASNHTSEKISEKILADAEKSGRLKLSKKNLRAIPTTIGSFNLIDLLHIDLSNNRFVDFPKQLCSCQFVQDIDCSHNSIRSLPDTFRMLVNLQHLDLSYNCLAQLPLPLCELRCLQVLLLNNNKLTELPREVVGLTQLLHLEASNNALQSASPQIGSLQRLRVLKLRNNRLITVPDEWSSLKLKCLDLAGNKLQQIPHQYRLLDDTLEELHLELNPLLSPPATVCARGLRHVMKYLTVESIRETQTLSASAHGQQWKQHRQQNGFASQDPVASSAYLRKLYVNTSPPKAMPTTMESESTDGAQQQQPFRSGSGGRGSVQFTPSSSVMERLQMQSNRLGASAGMGGIGGGVVKSSSFSSALSSHAAPPPPATAAGAALSHSPSAYQIGDHRGLQQQLQGRQPPLASLTSHGGDEADSRWSAATGATAAGAVALDTRSIGLMKSIVERRLGLTLPDTPDALTEALRDGVLLCYLANQIAPGSIPRVHVPPPGASQLPLPKSRRNIENFLALCRRIGLPGSQSFLVTDLMSGTRGLLRVAKTVMSLEELASKSQS